MKKRYRRLTVLLIIIGLCAGGVWLTFGVTAEYPAVETPVSYPVNEVDGFESTLDS